MINPCGKPDLLLCMRAGANAPNFVATAFNVLLPTPTQIQAFLNKQTGNKLVYIVSSLLGSPAGAALTHRYHRACTPSSTVPCSYLSQCSAESRSTCRNCSMGVHALFSQQRSAIRRVAQLVSGVCARPAAVVNGVRSCPTASCVDLSKYAFMKSDACICNPPPLLGSLAAEAADARVHFVRVLVGRAPALLVTRCTCCLCVPTRRSCQLRQRASLGARCDVKSLHAFGMRLAVGPY